LLFVLRIIQNINIIGGKKYRDGSVKLVVHNLLTTNLERVNIHESEVVLYLS